MWKYFLGILKNIKINGTDEPGQAGSLMHLNGRAEELPDRAGLGLTRYFWPVQSSSLVPDLQTLPKLIVVITGNFQDYRYTTEWHKWITNIYCNTFNTQY